MALVVNLKDATVQLRKQFDTLTGRQVAQAAASAINKVLKSDRSMIGREIRSEYTMGVFDAKSEISQSMASVNKLIGSLSGNAGFTPFEYFKIGGESNVTGSTFKVKRTSRYAMVNGKRKVVGKSTDAGGQGRHATFEVTIKKGHTSIFAHAFMANTKNGPMLFNRGEYTSRTNVFNSISRRNPMMRLRTLSVYQEMTNKRIMGKSEFLLRQEYERELRRLMLLRLSGQGAWR